MKAREKGDTMSARRSIKREVKAILSASALVGLGAMAPAHSQDTSDNVIGEVLVKGIRYSHQQAIQIKRDAVGVVDAISAEDVGKFPDKNLAEALQRIPGVVINREFGEGERVNIRGTDDALTRTLLNGHSLSTADWFILDQLDTTRSFNYLMLPADLIAQTVLYKTSQADLEEGGIGGTVNVITRNPLDLPSGTIFGKLEGTYSELADEVDPNAGALVSWKNSDESVGVLLAGVYQERHIRRDGVEVLTYTTANVGGETVFVPGLIGSALFQQDRKRTGGNFALQFRPSDSMDFNLTGLYSKFDADNINQNFMAWGQRALDGGGTLTNAVIENGTAVAGTITSPTNGTTGRGVVFDAIDRFATSESRNIDLDSNFQLSDALGLHVRVGYTDAEGNTDAQPFVEFAAPAAFNYDLRGSAPQVTYIPNGNNVTVNPENPSSLLFDFSSLHEILNNDDETYLYGDLDWQLDAGALKSIKFGAKYTDHERELIFNATTYGGFHALINTMTPGDFAGGSTPGDFLDDIKAPGTVDSYWQVNRGNVESILFDNLNTGPGRVYYPQQNFSVAEEVYGGYVMGNFEGESWRGNLGLRYVNTDQESRGNVVYPAGQGPVGSTPNPFGDFEPIVINRSYDDVLPSLNIAYDLSDDKVLRFAAARVMTRPNYTDIAPRTSLNPGALTGTSGNPELDPFRANQADLSFEWYPTGDSIVALAAFYKDIKSFITDNPVTQNFSVESQLQPSLACTSIGTDLWDCPFTINQRTNGGGGKMQGAELAATWPIAGGFGVQGNYTYTDAEADNGDPLPGASEDTFNLTAYFENTRVSARLAYTYRSEFFVTFDRNTPLNQDELEQLDLSVVVNILDNLALTFDGVNLTDEDIVQFSGNKSRPRAIYDNGPVYFAGVRMRF
jgi:iron complex outermembrane receptor protein